MKTHIKILLIVGYLVVFTLLLPFIFGLFDKLPDSYALGVIAVLIIVFIYCFIPYKIWKVKNEFICFIHTSNTNINWVHNLYFVISNFTMAFEQEKMKKETFHKKGYFRLIQVIFLCAFIFFMLLGIWGIFYEDDTPLVAFFYAGVVAIAYWLIKRILRRKAEP